jgi:hypothetical protein
VEQGESLFIISLDSRQQQHSVSHFALAGKPTTGLLFQVVVLPAADSSCVALRLSELSNRRIRAPAV